MTPAVLVIGDGAAGVAAAWRAASLGAKVTVVSAGAGASTLAGGAVDDAPWEEVVRAAKVAGVELAARALDEGVASFAEALDLWALPPEGAPLALLATLGGRLRPARGHDRALLDLSKLQGATVAVPRVDRPGWDADSLAASWSDDASARRRGLRFEPIDAALLRYVGEDRIADADLAERHDDPARLTWLAARLREAFSRARRSFGAVIVGPWLGLSRGGAEELTGLAGVPAGEALAGAGSPAGLRFARARDRLLGRAAVTVLHERVTHLSAGRTVGLRVSLHDSESAPVADRVVIACGGLVGGGIVYDPLEAHAGADMPDKSGPSFRFSFEMSAPSADRLPFFVAGGARLGVVSSMFGLELDRAAWPSAGRPGLLETVGAHCDDAGMAAPDIAAAGDVVADRPRTLLAAVRSGLVAGARAAAPIEPVPSSRPAARDSSDTAIQLE